VNKTFETHSPTSWFIFGYIVLKYKIGKLLLLYREIIAVFSEIHIKLINTLCEQNVELLNVKPGGTYSNHLTIKG
jgi:hypothetical protein